MNPILPCMPDTAGATADAVEELPIPYIELNAQGVITYANRAARVLHPPELGELVGQLAWKFILTDEQDSSFAAFVSSMESGQDSPVVRRSLYDRSGQFRIYEMHRAIMRAADGKPCGMRMVGMDVTEAVRALEEASCARHWLESAIESLQEAIIMTDALGFIRSVNPAAEALLGWKAAELIGKVIEKGMPVLRYVSDQAANLTFTMGLDGNRKGVATILNRDGRELQVEIGTSPILDKKSGFTVGVVGILRRLEPAA